MLKIKHLLRKPISLLDIAKTKLAKASLRVKATAMSHAKAKTHAKATALSKEQKQIVLLKKTA